MTTHETLEFRFRRLLKFYPRRYRAERGDEIVGTYLDSAEPHRTRPSLADTADMAKAGLRQRLRPTSGNFPGGLQLAAIMSFCFAAGIAADTWWQILAPPQMVADSFYHGHYASSGIILASLWTVAVTSALFLPGKFTRIAIGVALVGMVGVTVANFTLPILAPSPVRLFPQFAFGLLALAWPANPGRLARMAPTISLPVGIAVSLIYASLAAYLDGSPQRTSAAIQLVLLAGVLVAARVVIIGRGSRRYHWAAAMVSIAGYATAVLPTLMLVMTHSIGAATTIMVCAITWLAVTNVAKVASNRRDQVARS